MCEVIRNLEAFQRVGKKGRKRAKKEEKEEGEKGEIKTKNRGMVGEKR